MANALDVLSGISGLPKGEIEQMARDICDNNRRLNACASHSFTVEMDADKPRALRRWACGNCGGWVNYLKKLEADRAA